MEETNQNQPITQPIAAPVQSQSQLPIFLSILVTALIVGGGTFSWQSKANQKNMSQLQAQISDLQNQLNQTSATFPTSSSNQAITPTPTATIDKTTSWQTHTDNTASYSIKYPKGWRKVDFGEGSVGVGPADVVEDVKWGVWVYDSSATSIDTIISEFGKQFADRKEKREEVVISAGGQNIKATKVTVTTPQLSDWYSVNIVFANRGKIFSIGNGAVKDSDFDLFYNSFTRL